MNSVIPMDTRPVPRQPMIWSGPGRIVACTADGTVVGTFSTMSEAQRALAGTTRRWSGMIGRRPRYARTAA
jgi:hypothetical protein